MHKRVDFRLKIIHTWRERRKGFLKNLYLLHQKYHMETAGSQFCGERTGKVAACKASCH